MTHAAVSKTPILPKTPARRVLFARVGWMTYYAGPQAGDERPKGGGGYTKDYVGHEVFNFTDFGGRLYGFVRAKHGRINLERIDSAAGSADKLDDVLVILVARQLIIGWYQGAVVHSATAQFPAAVTNEITKRLNHAAIRDFKIEGYRFEAPTDKATLLPTHERTHAVPGNVKGGFGQSNVCYLKDESWMEDAVSYVLNHDKGNLLKNLYAEVNSENTGAIAEEQAAGFQSNTAIRRAIELHAMKTAQKALEERGYGNFSNTSLFKPYDYTCIKDGTKFFVEVKGTQTTGKTIVLTKNEVEHVRANPDTCNLALVHSVTVSSKNGVETSGGTTEVRERWQLKGGELTAIQYVWTVS